MANKKLFGSNISKVKSNKYDTTNLAGGKAFKLSDKGALAQLCATGCLNGTYYATAEDQLSTILENAVDTDPRYVAKLALYCREKGYMKDTPALLCAVLTLSDKGRMYLNEIFDRVINNGKMLRNFVQIMRSGAVGRKSLGSCAKKLVQNWFNTHTPEFVFKNSIGNDPSMEDVIKLSHPHPSSKEMNALFGYMLGKEHNKRYLPSIVKEFESFKETGEGVPDLPFMKLASLELNAKAWKELAEGASWQTLRMNLNTFARHGVFNNKALVKKLADKLANPEEIKNSNVFPYQLMTAYLNTSNDVPHQLKEALQDAMEYAVDNVPEIDGKIYICPDVSGSMDSPVTGNRGSATSVVRCVDVAALISAALLRKNKDAEVLPFDEKIHHVSINPRDSIMTNAKKLSINGGGTNCELPLVELNRRNAKGDAVIYISDNESWADRRGGMAPQWEQFKHRNKNAKLICIDITPNETSQVRDGSDRLNVGGFSDTVFDVMQNFINGDLGKNNWVSVIDAVKI